MTSVFVREKWERFGHRDREETHRGKPCNDGCRDWTVVSVSPGTGIKQFASEPPEETNSAKFDFWFQEL